MDLTRSSLAKMILLIGFSLVNSSNGLSLEGLQGYKNRTNRKDGQGSPLCGVSGVLPSREVTGQDRIIGGRAALQGEFPWQVSIQTYQELFTEWEHTCGGVLISENYVLTAAHCVNDVESTSDIRVLGGGLNYKSGGFERPVEKVIHHEAFDSLTLENDIGLIKLRVPFNFVETNGVLNAACLPFKDIPSSSYIRGNLTVSGWGAAREFGEFSDLLQAAEVPLVDQSHCLELYGDGVVSNGMLCAGANDGERDSCQGDSGGPLIGRDKSDRAVVMGIVSWGYGCATTGYPGVYTDVASYVDWVIKHAD